MVLITSEEVEKGVYLDVKLQLVKGMGSRLFNSHLTGFEWQVQAGEMDKWKGVEDAQKYRSSLGSCVWAGEVDLEGSRPSQSRLLSPGSSQIEVLLPQRKRNCFLGVRNKKRLEVDFNLGTWQNPSCCPQTTRIISFPLSCSDGFFLNFIADVRLMLLKYCFNSDL